MTGAPSRLDRAWDVGLALLVAGNVVWTTLCLGGYRPETMAVSSPLLLVTLALAWTRRVILRTPVRRSLAVWWPVPFLGYAVANVLFLSPVHWLGWLDWLLWLHLATAFWVGLEVLRRPVGRAIVWTTFAALAGVAVGLAVYQRLVDPAWLPMGRTQALQYLGRSGGPFGIPNSFAAWLLLLLPAAVALAFAPERPRGWRVVAGGLAVVLGLGFVTTVSRGAWLSLALAACAAPLWVARWSWERRLAAVAAVAALTVAAGAALYLAVPEIRGRLDAFRAERGERTRPIMWRMSWNLFRDEPVWGTGAGSYRILLERHRPEAFRDAPRWAHNDYLNTLSDYGAVGFGLAFGAAGAAAGWTLRQGRRRRDASPADARIARALEVGLLAFALSLLVDFHLKIPAIALLLGLVLAEWMIRCGADASGPASRGSGLSRLAWGAAAAALVALALGVARPRWAGEALRYSARQTLDELAAVTDPVRLRAQVEPVVAALEAAVAVDPKNAQAWAELSAAQCLRAHYTTAGRAALGPAAETAARRALALSDVQPEAWAYLGMSLDLQGRWVEAGACFTRALQLAPNQQLMWFYQAQHLSLRPAMLPLARAAVATCLRLDPGNPAAEALRERLRAKR